MRTILLGIAIIVSSIFGWQFGLIFYIISCLIFVKGKVTP